MIKWCQNTLRQNNMVTEWNLLLVTAINATLKCFISKVTIVCYMCNNGSNPKATVSVCSDQWYFNDKPADGFQQKRWLGTSIKSFTTSSLSEQLKVCQTFYSIDKSCSIYLITAGFVKFFISLQLQVKEWLVSRFYSILYCDTSCYIYDLVYHSCSNFFQYEDFTNHNFV